MGMMSFYDPIQGESIVLNCTASYWLPHHCSTPSQMCGSWYLPRSLLREVINPDEHCFLYGPGDALGLPQSRIYYKGNIINTASVIYRYKCDHLQCTMEYISETGRTFGYRYKEHLRSPSSIYDHDNTMIHSIKLDTLSTVCRVPWHQDHKGSNVHQVNTPLNMNLGKY